MVDLNGQIYDPSYFGPNFDIATPEPSSAALIGAGLVGLGWLRRRKVKSA